MMVLVVAMQTPIPDARLTHLVDILGRGWRFCTSITR